MCLEGSMFLGMFIAALGGVAVTGYYAMNKFLKSNESKDIIIDEVARTD